MLHRENYRRSLQLHSYETNQQQHSRHALTCVYEYLSDESNSNNAGTDTRYTVGDSYNQTIYLCKNEDPYDL